MNIVFFITDNYPNSLGACNVKAEYMALGLKKCGCTVSFADSLVGQSDLSDVVTGESDSGISYCLFPRKKSPLFSPLNNFKHAKHILKVKKGPEENIAIIIPELIPYYYYLARICHKEGYKVVVQYHEYFTSFPNGGLLGFDYKKRDQMLGKPVDGILPISHFLEEKAAKFNKPQLILPILSEYSRSNEKYSGENIFTFCGSAGYLLRYTIFVDAFVEVCKNHNDALLKLVIFGGDSQIAAVKQLLIDKGIERNASIYTQIPQNMLYEMYDTSLGLLIPLDPNNLQDKARFSQKIAEYLGSKRPIITTSVGEIPYYFDKKSAVIVDYTVDGFVEGMELLIEDKKLAECIGKAGYDVGVNNYDYVKNAQKMIEFFKTL